MVATVLLFQDETTPLMAACPFGSAATARVLLDHGANIEHCDKVRDLKHAHTH